MEKNEKIIRGRPKKPPVNDKKKAKPISGIEYALKPIKTEQNAEELILHLPITLVEINHIIGGVNPEPEPIKQEKVIVPEHVSSHEDKAYIKKLEQEIERYKEIFEETAHRKLIKTTCCDMIDSEGSKVICEKTDIACWWCSYNFDTVPCVLPEKLYEDKYHVFGCFCTLNCAAAYNINMNDYKVWDRYSLLKKLYGIEKDVPLAPARECFKKFGGSLLHEQHLINCIKCTNEYRFVMPPLISIIPYIEQISLINKNNKLILKRSKPLPSNKCSFYTK